MMRIHNTDEGRKVSPHRRGSTGWFSSPRGGRLRYAAAQAVAPPQDRESPLKQVDAQPEEQLIIGHRRLLLRTLSTRRLGRFSMSGNPTQVWLYLGSRAAYAGAFRRDPRLHFDDVALRSPWDLGRRGWRISPAGEPRPRYHALPPCTSEVTPSLGALSDKVRARVPNPITRVVPSDGASRAAPL
jgi:hypothetical protein